MSKTLKTIILSILIASINIAQTTKWDVDKSHSKVHFSVSHMVISDVTGSFKNFTGDISTQDEDFTKSQIKFTIETKSIDTDEEKRDEHLRSDDFFNAEKYPEIVFVGKSMKKVGKNKYKLSGDFTIRNITKRITLDATYNGSVVDSWGNKRAGFKLNGTINRFDYGLKWNNLLEAGSAVVGKDVDLIINLELIKQKQKS